MITRYRYNFQNISKYKKNIMRWNGNCNGVGRDGNDECKNKTILFWQQNLFNPKSNILYPPKSFLGSWSCHEWPRTLSKRPQGTIDTNLIFIITQLISLWSTNVIFSEKIKTFQMDKDWVSMVAHGLFDKIHGHSWSDHEPALPKRLLFKPEKLSNFNLFRCKLNIFWVKSYGKFTKIQTLTKNLCVLLFANLLSKSETYMPDSGNSGWLMLKIMPRSFKKSWQLRHFFEILYFFFKKFSISFEITKIPRLKHPPFAFRFFKIKTCSSFLKCKRPGVFVILEYFRLGGELFGINFILV